MTDMHAPMTALGGIANPPVDSPDEGSRHQAVSDETRRARRALAHVGEAGDPRLAQLVRERGAEQVWDMIASSSLDHAWTRRARLVPGPDDLDEREARAGACFIVPGDPMWPVGLDDLAHAEAVSGMAGVPLGLWVRGSSDIWAHDLTVAIVGSRASTPYGERIATDFAAALAARGCCVGSGAAYGIDAAAHRGALSGAGLTWAALAGGVDEPYPRLNAALIEQIATQGALVSEYPLGEHPTRPRFLARNRLIAAMSQAVVIVEAGVRSGARNSGSWATALGRPLLAVPGPITSATAQTPHRLIRSGEAVLAGSVDDIVEAVTPLGTVRETRPRREQLLDRLEPDERAVYEALPARGRRRADEVAVRAGLPYPRALAALGRLAERDMAAPAPGGAWSLGTAMNRPMLPSEEEGSR